MYRKLIVLVFILVPFIGCSAISKNTDKKNFFSYAKILVPKAELRKAGVFALKSSKIIVINDGILISYMKGNVIAKFNNDGNAKVKYTHKGQGPGEFNIIKDIFLLNDNIIAAIDNSKIIIFDNMLNFKKEIRNNLQSSSFYFYRVGNNWLRGVISENGWRISYLDDNFKNLSVKMLPALVNCNSISKFRRIIFFSALRPLTPKHLVYYSPFVVGNNCSVKVLSGTDLTLQYNFLIRFKDGIDNCKEVLTSPHSRFVSAIVETSKYFIVAIETDFNNKGRDSGENSKEIVYIISKKDLKVHSSFKTKFHLLNVLDYVHKDRVYLEDENANLVFCKIN